MVAKSVAPVKKASAVKKDTKKKPHKERVTCQRINEKAEIAVRKHITDLGFPEQCARLLQCTLEGNVTRQKNFEINGATTSLGKSLPVTARSRAPPFSALSSTKTGVHPFLQL